MTVNELSADLSQLGDFTIKSMILVDPKNSDSRWTYYDNEGFYANTKEKKDDNRSE